VSRAAIPALLLAALAMGGCGGDSASVGTGEDAPRVLPLEVSAAGSGEFRARGADNSIANYGSEASRRELRAAAALAHGYFAALATEDWAGACARLSAKVVRGAERLATASHELRGRSCARALEALFGRVTAAEGREATAMDAAALRQEGGLGFLIYRGIRGRPYFIKLSRGDDGGWSVDALSPTGLG
jgi:hypothetical protein